MKKHLLALTIVCAVFCGYLTGCGDEANNTNNQAEAGESVGTEGEYSYIELEYLGETEYNKQEIKLFKEYFAKEFGDREEFTYWDSFGGELYSDWIEERYNVKLDDDIKSQIDIAKETVIISCGRKLKYMIYKEGTDYGGYLIAEPVFEEEYSDSSLYVYKTEGKYSLYDAEFNGNLFDFNIDGNVPFSEDYYDGYTRFN
ncbi:MAG: hypothetical protein LUC97_12170 [Clostridiales bacterium]|nr:hypothetical protein [Clostridiales bacterium]